MPRRYNLDARLGAPRLAHTMTESAEAARVAVRRFAHKRKLDREMGALVTRHGQPKRTPIPASAERFRMTAERKGFDVHVVTGHRVLNPGKSNERNAFAWTVAGLHALRGLGFRAVWVDGKAHEGQWRTSEGSVDVGIAGILAELREMPDA